MYPIRRFDRVQWLLGVVILLALGTLMLTLGWYMLPERRGYSTPITPTPAPVTVRLSMAGSQMQVQTLASSVSDFLTEQNIRLSSDDAISAALSAPLHDGMQITISRARSVLITVDGTQQRVRTPFTNPYDILQQQGIALGSHDRVWIDGTLVEPRNVLLWPHPVSQMTLERARAITIVDGENTQTLYTTADTVGEALFEAEITLYITDRVTPALDAALQDATRITLERARPVFIHVDGSVLETRVQGNTVGDALAEAGVALMGLDYSIPAETEPIEAGSTITVLRVTEEIISDEERIPFETRYQADPETPLDETRVLQAGAEGIRRHDTRVRYADGQEIGREPAGSSITQQPQHRIIGYGTQIVLRTIDTPDGPRQYWRRIRAYATSYHPAALGGDNVTAIGMMLEKGIIAADPNIIPYRTNLYVPGYGTGVMADTGGPRSSPYWVDLGYSDADWVPWSRYVDVYLLTPVPDDIDYRLPAFTRLRGT